MSKLKDIGQESRFRITPEAAGPMREAIAHAARIAGQVAKTLYETALAGVLAHQMSDGGWATGYGEKHRPLLTVDALFVLSKAGLI